MTDRNEARPGSLAGLFPVLRQLRLRAGLTQRQIAEATRSGGTHGHKLIARLEAGHVPNPSARLLLDYLRACGAKPDDLREFLDQYLSVALSVPARPARGPARNRTRGPGAPRPEPEDAATLALRQGAAWWNLRKVIEHMLHHELNEIGARPMSVERKYSADFGRKVFRILYQTRQSRPALRERRLKRCRAWAERKNLPAKALDHLHSALTALFAEMERDGDLEWLPPADQARHLMLLPPRRRLETDYEMCRHEFIMEQGRKLAEQEAARKPVIEAALNLLKSEGLGNVAIGNYRFYITGFLKIAETTASGSDDRTRRTEELIHCSEHPYISQPLLYRLAELVMSLRNPKP
jgi:transcriptional regulator with XRE-family HTH domain